MNTSDLIYPTPTASSMPCEGTVRLMRKFFKDGRMTLEEASAIAGRDVRLSQGKVKAMYPTPTVCGLDGGSNSRRAAKRRGAYPLQNKLNPNWVEWLMGWGIGWTDPEVENEDIVYLPLGKDPADDGLMGRLTDRKENRVSRIKALGNGQVPLCAAVAFEWGMTMLDGME